MTSNDTRTTTDTSSWDAPAPGHISLGGNPGTDENRDRVGSVVTERAVVSAPDASAATPGTLLPAAADHFALFQDVEGEDLRAWADAQIGRAHV